MFALKKIKSKNFLIFLVDEKIVPKKYSLLANLPWKKCHATFCVHTHYPSTHFVRPSTCRNGLKGNLQMLYALDFGLEGKARSLGDYEPKV
jgi:hypothetical protein